MEREHTEKVVEHEDGHAQHRARLELPEGLEPSEGRVLELRRVLDVLDRDGRARPRRQIGDGQCRPRPNGLQAGDMPLGCDVPSVSEPDQAAVDFERRAGLADGDVEELVDLELGADARGDVGDETLPLQRVGERDARAGTVERERGLRREPLHQRELVGLERARPGDGADRQHGDHALVGDQRNERKALRLRRLHHSAAQDLGRRSVVDGEGSRLEGRRRDTRGLVHEVHPHLGEPVELSAVDAPHDAGGTLPVVVDAEKACELDADVLLDLRQQRGRDGRRVVASPEGDGHVSRRQVVAGQGASVLGLAPAREDEDGRDGGGDREAERQPDAARWRLRVDEQDDPVDRGDRTDDREDEEDRAVEQRSPPPLTPEGWCEQRRRAEVRGGHEQQRHCVEPQGFVRL